MEKIAITGSTGFIGSQLLSELVRRGHIVYPIGRTIRQVECDIVYHLACPATTEIIQRDPTMVMDAIFDVTRQAMKICPTAKFVNGSTMGVHYPDSTPQGAYNVAKGAMEVYLQHSGIDYINYRIPSVYGEGMHSSAFIKRCVDGTAYAPAQPDKEYWICHISKAVKAMADLAPIPYETTTLGEIYKQFTSGRSLRI
jgi:nucleoside-diphosphate-sugar epimerase